uniref:Uncharacterized protein n=1 Tax=Macaca fascicularis TaxID=9541 RepID=A0A7N9DGM9_MACFA
LIYFSNSNKQLLRSDFQRNTVNTYYNRSSELGFSTKYIKYTEMSFAMLARFLTWATRNAYR